MWTTIVVSSLITLHVDLVLLSLKFSRRRRPRALPVYVCYYVGYSNECMYHSKYIPRKVKEIVMEILSSVYVGFPTIFVLLDSWEEIWQVMVIGYYVSGLYVQLLFHPIGTSDHQQLVTSSGIGNIYSRLQLSGG